MVQRLKRGHRFAASYKPSVLANPDRIITAFAVDPSSETKVVEPMLDQSARVTGDDVKELLLDAGYFDNEVINTTIKRDILSAACRHFLACALNYKLARA